MTTPFETFLCPSDPYRGLTTNWGTGGASNGSYIIHYHGVAGPDEGSTLQWPDAAGGGTSGHCNRHLGMFFNDSRVTIGDIVDGTSNTAAICEVWGRTSVMHNASGESSRSMNLHAVVYFGYTPNSNRSSPPSRTSFMIGTKKCCVPVFVPPVFVAPTTGGAAGRRLPSVPAAARATEG
jgi:hypothetical protein